MVERPGPHLDPGTAGTGRRRLPNRRDSRIETLEVAGQTSPPALASAPRLAGQSGVSLAALAKSVGRAPNASTTPGSLDHLNAGSQPTSALGAALDLLVAHEPRPDGAPSGE